MLTRASAKRCLPWLMVLASAVWSAAAGQSRPFDGSKDSPGSPFRQGPYETDPDLPRSTHLDHPVGGGIISWQYPSNVVMFNPFIPEVVVNSKIAEYLGFVDGVGTLLECRDHAIYAYDGSVALHVNLDKMPGLRRETFTA
jgi:hypothetical protein